MAIELEIRDGAQHWWLSPDIWVVPDSDPEGPKGQPVAGQPAYLWARVTNNGTTPVQNATVRFYWANPNVGFDRTTANLVGTAFVTLASNGDSSDVLCLTPWLPSFGSNGHVCVLAEAFHSSDPLAPGAVFNQPTDRHVAQLNLNVAQVGAQRLAEGLVEIHNPGRRDRDFTITVQAGKVDEVDAELLLGIGVPKDALAGDGQIARLGLLDAGVKCPTKDDLGNAQEEMRVKVPGGGIGAVRFVAELEGRAALVHVTQHVENATSGGASFVLLQEG